MKSRLMSANVEIMMKNKIILNHKSFGTGEPVLIFHGLLGMLDNWKSFARKLSETHKVYIIDQRDHGRSPWTEEFNYDVLAEDINDFMEQQELESAHLIGHSMGGKSVLRFTQLYPDKVKIPFIIDMGIKKYEAHHHVIFDALRSLDLNELIDRKGADEKLSKKIPDFGIRQFLMKNLTRIPEGGFKWKMNLELIYNNYEHILDSVEHEVCEKNIHFIYGTKSTYIHESDMTTIKEYFPNAHFDSIDTGHWVHAEKPTELLAIITAHLKNGL